MQLQKQVGTMIKMDADVGRLVTAINGARDMLVSDIRGSLQALFLKAREDEAALLSTVVRENRFFQTQIGQRLLAPRISQLEGPMMQALSTPVHLQMDTEYAFPSVPREEVSRRLADFASTSGTQVVPGAPAPQTRLSVDTRYIHWQPGMVLEEKHCEAPGAEDYLSQLDWTRPGDHPEWTSWVSPHTQRTPARAMLAGNGPSRVTFNSPSEVMLSQSEQHRQYREYLSLERLPMQPQAMETSGPPMRQRPWHPRGAKPQAAPPPVQAPRTAAWAANKTHKSPAAFPQKGFALPHKRAPLEAAVEQSTAEHTAPQVPAPAPGPPFAIQRLPGYGDRSADGQEGSGHPQFYRITGVANGDRDAAVPEKAEPLASTAGRRPSSAGLLPSGDYADGRALSMEAAPKRRAPSAGASRLQGTGRPNRPMSPLRAPPASGLPAIPVLTIPGESSISREATPRHSPEHSEAGPEHLELRLGASAPMGSAGVASGRHLDTGSAEPSQPRGFGALEGPFDETRGQTLLQKKHRVVAEFALRSSGSPEVLQQKLVAAVQDARERWNRERRQRMQLEARVRELERAAQPATTRERPASASRVSRLARPQSAGGAVKEGPQAVAVQGEASRADSIDGAVSVGGWSDTSNDPSVTLPHAQSSEAIGGDISTIPETP